MFVPCTALLYEQNSNNKVFHNSIEHFLYNPSDFFSDDVLSCLWIVFTNSIFQLPLQKLVRWVEILGIGWPPELFNRVMDNFNVRVAAVLSYNHAVHGTNIVLITEKV